jgi:hypothetical protein
MSTSPRTVPVGHPKLCAASAQSRRQHAETRQVESGRANRAPRPTDDCGQAMPFVLVIVVMVALSCIAMLRLSHAATDAARARTAADAAALAGVRDGQGAARRLATANGGSLVEFREISDVEVEVVVQVGEARAVATAELAVALPPGPP